MRWEDERYVRIYTRDSVDWLSLSFIAQGLFCLILRKVDRAGIIRLGKHGRRAVAVVIGFPGEWTRLEPALEELIADGCVRVEGENLIVPNFIEAQEATQSDAQRKRESRARARDIAAAASVLVTDKVSGETPNPDKASGNVTERHESGQKVTSGHGASHAVTPSLAVPCLAVPSETERLEPYPSAAPSRIPQWPSVVQTTHPAVWDLYLALQAAGHDVTIPKSREARDAMEADVVRITLPAAITECKRLLAKAPEVGSMAYFVDALRKFGRAAPTNPNAMQPVGQDWTAKL